MCLSQPKTPNTPPPPAPPPPSPEFSGAESVDLKKDGVRRRSQGTEALRIDRSTVATGDAAGLQVTKRKPRTGADAGDGAGGGPL